MGEVINLNRARKERQRQAKDRRAGQNRVRFGRGKAEKTAEIANLEQARHRLDGARLDHRPGTGDDTDQG